jgi:hypothetical protein
MKMRTVFFAVVALLLTGGPADKPAIVVQAPDSPVRIDRTVVLTAPETPPVLLYQATNLTDQPLEQFTVMVFVFAADGALKARQVAPGRRTLDARGAKYSAMVLDGSEILPTDVIVAGVNQAQRAGSETWWRADVQAAAEAAVPRKKR